MTGRENRADLAFIDGPVATMDAARSFTDAVAVRHGRIVAVGDKAVRPLVDRHTEIVSLRHRLLVPGFHDAHVHPIYGGLQRLRCDLSGAANAPEHLLRIEDYARVHPEMSWILGGGWSLSQFPRGAPQRGSLDLVTGPRPAYLVSSDQHSAWVNSAALRIAGISETTPDPIDGRIERDPQGNPTGILHEGATELVARLLPAETSGSYLAALLEGQRHLHACGVTSWHDAIIGPYLGYADTLDTYLTADEQQLLTGRATGALWWDYSLDESQVEELLQRRERAQGKRFSVHTVKIMQDGVCENFTASLLLPYIGEHGSGHSNMDRQALCSAVRRLDAEGFQVHVHAVGDRAIREALDSFEFARECNGASTRRHQIAHVQVVNPSDILRFHDLGVTANIQARWAVNDDDMTKLTAPFLGTRRTGWQYPFQSLRRAGVVLAGGSDWPVSEADPLQAIHVAVNRQECGVHTMPLLPQQRLDLVDALAAHTIGSAWLNHVDQDTGSIELGKRGDLTVVDRDLFSLKPENIGASRVDMTIVDGNVVYERSSGDSAL